MTAHFGPTVKPKTHVHLILDDSASIANSRLTERTQDAFNRNLQAIKKNALATGQETTVSVWLFGARVDRVVTRVPAEQALTLMDYRPSQNWTRLNDVLGEVLEAIAREQVGNQDAFLVLGFTDGENNRVDNFDSNTLARMVKRAQATDRVTITMLVPSGYGRHLAADLGLAPGNIREWDLTEAGLQQGGQAQEAALGSYFGLRARNVTSTKSFYETNAGGVSKAAIRRTMENVSGHVQTARVGRRTDISSFCERQFGGYQKGAAFYQLVKKEKVHGHKKLAIVDEDGSVYIGKEDARALLGLPEHADATVVPGDHGKRKVFVQSTSVNRKLDANTEVLWAPRYA